MNTADKKKLVDRFSFSDALADAVVNTRASGGQSGQNRSPGGGKASPQRFNSLMDLLKVKARQSSSGRNSSSKDNQVNEITIKWLAEHFDELTLSDDERLPGRININTAHKDVIMALPEMTVTTAGGILRRRDSGEGPFQSVGELFTSKTVTEGQFKAFAETISVRSSVFEIRSIGVTKLGIRHEIVAVVDRGADPMAILYWYQSE